VLSEHLLKMTIHPAQASYVTAALRAKGPIHPSLGNAPGAVATKVQRAEGPKYRRQSPKTKGNKPCLSKTDIHLPE
jgi:hypothetical protein